MRSSDVPGFQVAEPSFLSADESDTVSGQITIGSFNLVNIA
jgi:hypothetical protein